MSKKPTIGVLALQGAVEPHRPHIEATGAQFCAVKTAAQFEDIDAFIIPGGESTTMLKLIERFNLWDALADQFSKKPVWGICAGAILLAETVYTNNPLSLEGEGRGEPNTPPHPNPLPSGRGDTQRSFGLMPMTIQRNGYGRQLYSHYGKIEGYDVSFIRAPIITQIAAEIEVLAKEDNNPIWLKSGKTMITTFHPELTLDFPSPMHKAFIDLVNKTQ